MANKNTYFYCNVEGNTDVGCKRPANEDWLDTFECKNGLVAVVCDGMGGHVGGQVASHLAVETIRQFLENNYFDNPKTAIVEACNAANQAILRRTSEQPDLTGMGSTCVLLIVRDGKVYIGSIGDSRIYLVRSKTIRQITKDQSYVQMLVDAGQISAEEAEHHPRKNEITNALGLPNMQPATIIEDIINPEAGDCFLLCSDGLSGMVSDREIAKVVSNQQGMSQRDRVNTLINKARQNGGHDNITCQIVEFSVTPPGSNNPTSLLRKNPLVSIIASVFLLCILSVGGYFVWKHFKDNTQQESAYVKELRDQENSSITDRNTDTIVFKKGFKHIFEIEQNDTYHALKITITTKNGLDSIIIQKPLKLADMTTSADDNISKHIEGNRCIIDFNEREFSDPDICLTFKGDSLYGFRFPVELPAEKKAVSITTETPQPKVEEKDPNRKGQVILDETDKNSDSSTQPQPNEVGIEVPKQGETIVKLYSKRGTNTNSTIYTDWAISSTSGSIDQGWYSYSSNGSECTISINGTKVPKASKDAVIKIPLMNTDVENYIIRVKAK